MFEFFVAHPHVPQLGAWHALEPKESQHRIPIIERAIKDRTRQIKRAQDEARISARLPPAELLAVANAIAGTWSTGPARAKPQARGQRDGSSRGVAPPWSKRCACWSSELL